MGWRLFPILVLSLLLFASGGAAAQSVVRYDSDAVVCPAGADGARPDFASGGCETLPLEGIDPQGREIWARVVFEADPADFPETGPLGLYLSMKGSSEIWFNGAPLGANGVPGANRRSEIPGKMDAVFYLPHNLIRAGENEIVLHASSHWGFIRLNHPFHYVMLKRYADPTRDILRAYWPSLITFGAFALGAIYFGVSAIRGVSRGPSLLLLALSLIATAQLALETSRGLFNYPYPFHDTRLALIAMCAAAFGLCLLFHVATRFLERRRAFLAIACGALLVMPAVIFPSGFDAKAVFGLLGPLTVAAAVAAYAAFKKLPAARPYTVALLAFVAVIFAFPNAFLDTGFFYAVAALLLFLMAQQAVLLSRERTLRIDAGDRARRLEIALEQARQQQSPERLKIQRAGKTDFLDANEILFCKGAGDYVELALTDGSHVTHLAKLQDMESILPETFLRVHRSYIVNTRHVRSLTREPSGVGALAMSNGESVPVSRRILPNVRSVLA